MAVGAERQRLDQLRPRLQILAMGGPDHLRMARDELLETGALGHAATEQQRAQAAVDEQRAGREAAAEARPRQAGRGIGHQAVGVQGVRSARSRVLGAERALARRLVDRRSRPEYEKTLPAGRVSKERSLIVQENLPGIGTLPARRR